MGYDRLSSSARMAKQRLQQNRYIPEGTTLEAIKKQMPDADAVTRLQIVHALDKLGTDDALATLTTLLLDDNSDVQQAIKSILLRPHPRYTQLLHRLALDETLERRCAVLRIIAADCSPHHVQVLALCLRDNEPPIIQKMAAQILQAIQTPEAVETVTTWRQQRFDSHAETQHTRFSQQNGHAPMGLVAISTPQQVLVNHRHAFSSLLNHVRSGRWGDQQDAAKAVHRLIRSICDDPSADYKSIRQDFIDALDDPEHLVRWVAIDALARLADPEAVPALLLRLQDPSWTVRIAAIRALNEIGDVAAVYELTHMVNDPNPNVQEAAVETIGHLGSHRDVPLLAAVVDGNHNDMVRAAAIEAIRRLHGASGNGALLRGLADANPVVRWNAAAALSELADENAVSVLVKHLNDYTHPSWEEKRVCDWLVDALVRIGTPVATVAVRRWQQASV